MKILLYILILGLLSCNHPTQQPNKSQSHDSIIKIHTTNKIDISKYFKTGDSLTITTEFRDTIKFGNEELTLILERHPELLSEIIQNPDQVYHCSGESDEFNSEGGQDYYFMLYAYFLKIKNGDQKFAERRKKLIEIYSNINALFAYFEYGGTYFGHQGARILGYAEFSIYMYKQNEIYDISKTYDITKQKEFYIKSLRQLINDESSIDFNTTGQEKVERTKTLNKIVNDIDKAITDNYYLRRTQDFHYGHYEYY